MVLSDSSLSEIARGIFQAKQPCKPTDDDNVTMGPVGFFLRGPGRYWIINQTRHYRTHKIDQIEKDNT